MTLSSICGQIKLFHLLSEKEPTAIVTYNLEKFTLVQLEETIRNAPEAVSAAHSAVKLSYGHTVFHEAVENDHTLPKPVPNSAFQDHLVEFFEMIRAGLIEVFEFMREWFSSVFSPTHV